MLIWHCVSTELAILFLHGCRKLLSDVRRDKCSVYVWVLILIVFPFGSHDSVASLVVTEAVLEGVRQAVAAVAVYI